MRAFFLFFLVLFLSFVLFCLFVLFVFSLRRKLRFDKSKTGKTEGLLQVDTVSQCATVTFDTLFLVTSLFLFL